MGCRVATDNRGDGIAEYGARGLGDQGAENQGRARGLEDKQPEKRSPHVGHFCCQVINEPHAYSS